MNDVAIRVENLGKRYRLGTRQRYKTLRDSLAGLVSKGSRGKRQEHLPPSGPPIPLSASRLPSPESDLLWALQDVSFEVKRGEVVGIIGRNGAGKSTLLKILSQITEPTEGSAEIYGRVGSLLEVGTGFHPELTGRENIFLNGAILGMRKHEITRKFDEIVAFAEVERFIDTPVKHYSSGMQMRLAFSVAAHLEPEILLVDEVLSVGDAAFQSKCLGKMSEVTKQGRTILFVSHQLNAVQKLTQRCLWIDAGAIRQDYESTKVIAAYEEWMMAPSDAELSSRPSATRFLEWRIAENPTANRHVLDHAAPFNLKLKLAVASPVNHGDHGIALLNARGDVIWAHSERDLNLKTGVYEFSYRLSGLPIRPGGYTWLVSLYDSGKLQDEWRARPELLVSTPSLGHPSDQWASLLNIACEFAPRRLEPSY